MRGLATSYMRRKLSAAAVLGRWEIVPPVRAGLRTTGQIQAETNPEVRKAVEDIAGDHPASTACSQGDNLPSGRGGIRGDRRAGCLRWRNRAGKIGPWTPILWMQSLLSGCKSLTHEPLRLLSSGATVAGRDSNPLGTGAFPWRTGEFGLVGNAAVQDMERQETR